MLDLPLIQIQESAITADTDRCVLPGVKVIGPNSANGRVYLPEALASGVPLYEGAKVKIDHPVKPGEPRSVTSLLGWLENVRIQGDSIYADLRYNPEHAFARELVWWAKNRPQQLGLSHNAIGTGRERQDGVLEVTKIVAVKSVDLVDDPATVNGLYESKETRKVKTKFKSWMEHVQANLIKAWSPVKKARLARVLREMDDTDKPVAALADQDMVDPGDSDDPNEALTRGFEAAMIAILRDTSIDAKSKAKKIAKYLKQHEKLLADDSEGPDNAPDDSEEDGTVAEESKKPQQAGQQTDLAEAERKELETLRLKEKHRANIERARKLCIESKLPAEAMTDYFLGLVAKCGTDAEMKAAIEDRKAIAPRGVQRPTSAAPVPESKSSGEKPKDVKEFSEALYKGTGIK